MSHSAQTSSSAEMSGDPLVRVRDLKVTFRLDKHNSFQAVKGISFDIPRNSTVALVGESGSGKSVTSLAILGLLPPENTIIDPASSIIYGGRDILKLPPRELRELRGADISMIFQEPMTSLNPVFTVGFQLEEVLRLHMGLAGAKARERAIALLGEVGIPDAARRIDAYPSQMSGGQQQRVMIAMAIACEPKLLIADEPTTALDVTIQKQILDLIAELQKRRQMSVLFITHDLAVVGEIADQVFVMRNGEIREQGPAKRIFEAPQDSYTKALLKCRPQMDRRPERLPVIEDFMSGQVADVDLPDRKRGVVPGDATVLEVKGLGKSFFAREGLFGKREFKAVQDVSFKLRKGQDARRGRRIGLRQDDGGAHAHALARGDHRRGIFDGKDILAMSVARSSCRYKRRIQIIFQNPYARLNPRFIVGQSLTEPMEIHGIGKDTRRSATELAFDAAAQGRAARAPSFDKYPHEFSGGQRQRIAIARCLTLEARDPDLRRVGVRTRRLRCRRRCSTCCRICRTEFGLLLHLHFARPRGGSSTSPTR